MPSFSPTLEHAIHSSLALANDRQHEFATLEHLLLALLDEPDAERVLLHVTSASHHCAKHWLNIWTKI